MKSLMLKTLLVISIVALTGAWAFAQLAPGSDVNLNDGLHRDAASTEGSTECIPCKLAAMQARLTDETAAKQHTVDPVGADGDKGNAENGNGG